MSVVDTAAECSMSRPVLQITNDSMSESVDLLQMLIAPPPPPPPPPGTSRPAAPPRRVEDGSSVAAAQRPRVEQMCYPACHACAEEQRYRQQQHQQPECTYCSCSQPRVDPWPQRTDRDNTAPVYFNPRGPLPPGSGAGPGCTWPRRPAPVKSRGSTLSAPRADVSGTSGSNCAVQAGLPGSRNSARRGDDVDDNDDYDDAPGKRTMSTSLSSRSSSRAAPLRSAAEMCRRVRRAAAADCCLRCLSRRRANTSSAATISGEPLHLQAAHGGCSEPVTAQDASVGKLGRKLSLRRGLRRTTKWNVNADHRRTILLVVGFLVGLFLVSTALLTGFVLLWPSQRRRHTISGITIRNKHSRSAYSLRLTQQSVAVNLHIFLEILAKSPSFKC